ncbi:MAG: carboxypeptidase-like regulatory domain-containing protein [Elusimicrobiota bacterium]|jgi:hypothetical protein
MRCPTCQVDYPPEVAECPKCGVVLAKWTSRKLALPSLEGEKRSSPVILYGGLIVAVLGGVYYWRQASAPPPAPAVSAPAVEAPPAPVAADQWRFDGTVFNLRTAAPVASAQVTFKSAGTVYQAVTDAGGNYRVDVPALETGAYDASVTHPDYRAGYIEGEPDVVGEEFRGRMDCAVDGEEETLRGKAGENSDMDFMLCPRKR